MQTLIITAHPSSNGFTHKIAQSFIDGIKSRPEKYQLINLYDQYWRQGFLEFENIKELPENPKRTEIQAKISESDEIVFIHPVWWGSMPAILKNFIDQNITAGFAYKYEKGGQINKLLKGKSARVILTCDVPLWQYFFIGLPIMTSWFFPILDFCGLEVKSFTVLDKMRKRSEIEKKYWLEQVFQMSKNDTKPFSILLFVFKIMSKIKGVLRI